jgi:hypothetical protein
MFQKLKVIQSQSISIIEYVKIGKRKDAETQISMSKMIDVSITHCTHVIKKAADTITLNDPRMLSPKVGNKVGTCT